MNETPPTFSAHKERLQAVGQHTETEKIFLRKTEELLARYESVFGVDDFTDYEL